MTSLDLDQLLLRAFLPDQDIPKIISLRLAAEAVDQEGIVVSEAVLREQLQLPGHDPLRDRWLIDNPDDSSSLVASALVRVAHGSPIADAGIVVHPAWRHRGLGSRLLVNIIERAAELNASSIQVMVNSKNVEANKFLHHHRFSQQGAYTELRLPAGVRLPPVVWPYGYTLRTYAEVSNLSTLTEAMNLCYIPLWGHQEVSEDEMASWLPDFNQDGLFLVFSEKGRVVGISRTEPSHERSAKNSRPTGYIDAPGIVPQHRRLDLYRALLLTGIRWLYSQGQELIEMESWGDKLEVLKMYRELGFQDMRQLISYRLDLRPQSHPGERSSD